jgi:hypothetical protein
MKPYNQMSRYGALSRVLPLMNPAAKVFFVGLSTASWYPDFGNIFPVDEDGVVRVYSSIATALTNCVASRGDVVLVLPGYTETVTAAITVSVAGVSIIGLGNGALKPTITVNFAGDGFNVTGANVLIDNIAFAAPETDEATAMVNLAAANVTLRNINGIGSKTSKNFVDCITIASGADDLTLENIKLNNSVVAVNSFLSIEAAVARMKIRGFRAFGDVATAGIIDAAAATHLDWEDVVVGVVGTTKPAATLDSNPTGLINRARFAGTHGTIATNANLGNAIRLFDVLVLEETDGSKQGAQIPAVDAD